MGKGACAQARIFDSIQMDYSTQSRVRGLVALLAAWLSRRNVAPVVCSTYPPAVHIGFADIALAPRLGCIDPVNNSCNMLYHSVQTLDETKLQEAPLWKQDNWDDCGVFVCAFMRELSSSPTCKFPEVRQEHIPIWRKVIALECYSGRLAPLLPSRML